MSRWLITGCSSGIGREVALAALRRGEQVMLTARRPETVDDICNQFPDLARSTRLDVTDPDQVSAAVEVANAEFGGIDVLVNNAGYGYTSAVEEGVDAEVRDLFETNFFSVITMLKAVLPRMRERGAGCIVNVSSMTGLVTNTPNTYYSASKHAVEALTKGLAKEVEPFGIRVFAVEPGAVQTDWASRSMQTTSAPMDVYADTVGVKKERMRKGANFLRGDAVKVGEAIVDAALRDDPPAHLLLGDDVLTAVREDLAQMSQLVEQWAEVSSSINRDDLG